jgi:hypothetical protein
MGEPARAAPNTLKRERERRVRNRRSEWETTAGQDPYSAALEFVVVTILRKLVLRRPCPTAAVKTKAPAAGRA